MTTLPNSSEILDFWFSERIRPFWFKSTPEFDQELRENFLNNYQAAVDGTLSAWEETPAGALALVIILDQFPRNMFRGQPQCFTSGIESLRIAADAIAKKFDQTSADEQKSFFYLPYMHSENLADQDRSVELYEKAGLEHNLDFARHHIDTLAMLQEKTKGNLSSEEDEMLEGLIHQLRMAFMAVQAESTNAQAPR